VADINNVNDGPFAGAITAALFLAEFVDATIPWVHIDMMAWNGATRAGRPEGGEATGLRALYALIAERFGPKSTLPTDSSAASRSRKPHR
jgi:leucyl aminopeptidase